MYLYILLLHNTVKEIIDITQLAEQMPKGSNDGHIVFNALICRKMLH